LRFNPDDSDIDEIKIAWGADLRFLSARVSREIAVVLPLDRQANGSPRIKKGVMLSETWRRAATSCPARHGQSRGFAGSPTTTKGAQYFGSANLDHVGVGSAA